MVFFSWYGLKSTGGGVSYGLGGGGGGLVGFGSLRFITSFGGYSSPGGSFGCWGRGTGLGLEFK